MNISDCFCFIPAKEASTRLKKKNILKINGKELIYYSIKAAKESKLFNDEIILSTESHQIKKIAISHGAKVPYLRDEYLAKDPYGVSEVIVDFLEKFPKYLKYKYMFVILPTAPLLSRDDITNCYEIIKKGELDCVMSISKTDHNSLRSVYLRKNKIDPIFPEFIDMQSQELEPTYRINGAVIVIKTKRFLEEGSYMIKPLGGYVMPPERSIDIDNEFDYRLAKILFNQKIDR